MKTNLLIIFEVEIIKRKNW